jgi:hypothetical protein
MDGWDGIRFIPAKIDRYRSIFVSIRARPTAKRETTYTGIPMALFIAAIALPSLSLQGVHASNMCVNLRACMRERGRERREHKIKLRQAMGLSLALISVLLSLPVDLQAIPHVAEDQQSPQL